MKMKRFVSFIFSITICNSWQKGWWQCITPISISFSTQFHSQIRSIFLLSMLLNFLPFLFIENFVIYLFDDLPAGNRSNIGKRKLLVETTALQLIPSSLASYGFFIQVSKKKKTLYVYVCMCVCERERKNSM